MKAAKLTAILLAAAIMLLVAVPQLRGTLDLLRYNPLTGQGTWLKKAEVERVVKQHPQDPRMWLAFAECGASSQRGTVWERTGPWDQSWSPRPAYERAISLAPDSPVPYSRYAIYLLADTGVLTREERGVEREEEFQRTATQVANLREAESLLQKAGALQSDNAACDYLLAYIYLAQHKDEQAFAVLRQGISKPRWDTYSQVAATAVLRLLDATGSASPLLETHALNIAVSNGIHITAKLRSLSWTLSGMGERSQNSAQHQKAILCYEAAVHLGYVMRKDAYTVIDGLVAIAVTAIPSGPFLSEEERQKILNETQKQQQYFDRQQDERMRRMEEARVANFAAYMRTHGRADLAGFYQKEVQAANQWLEECRAAADTEVSPAIFLYGWPRYSRLLWLQTGLLLALWLLVGLISLVVRYWREPRAGLAWPWWQWLLLIGVLLVGIRLVAPWAELHVYSYFYAQPYAYPIYMPAAIFGLSLTIAAWLVAALVVTLVKRARQVPAQRLGKARTYLATLRMLVPVTFAALFLLSVISLWPACQSIKPWRDQTRAEIQQGEVHYMGIGATNPTKHEPPDPGY